MKKHRTVLAVILMLSTLPAGAALAAKGAKDLPPGFVEGKKSGWADSEVPPGWENGAMEGWDGEDLPRAFSKTELTPVKETKDSGRPE